MYKKKTNEHGQTVLVATGYIPKGTKVINLLEGNITRTRELRTIEIGENMHSDHCDGGLVNHHCEPTCFVDKESRSLVADKNIAPGEVISFNYMQSESEISSSFECYCGSSKCQGFIGTASSKPTYLKVA
jgi:hypothetical protein